MSAQLHLGTDGRRRCWWCGDDPLYQRYHDTEWGHSLHGENNVFEKITLEGMQAGLSWITILRKRESFRSAFADFDIATVASFDDDDRARLLADAGIVRNRAKVDAAISNARVARSMLDGGESLDAFVWSFAPEPAKHRPIALGDAVQATSPESTAMSKALLKRGFRFVGPTTMYAFMQSAGMVDDHVEGCETRPKR
jgi:DNA-3-methyladenine glycosylase I